MTLLHEDYEPEMKELYERAKWSCVALTEYLRGIPLERKHIRQLRKTLLVILNDFVYKSSSRVERVLGERDILNLDLSYTKKLRTEFAGRLRMARRVYQEQVQKQTAEAAS